LAVGAVEVAALVRTEVHADRHAARAAREDGVDVAVRAERPRVVAVGGRRLAHAAASWTTAPRSTVAATAQSASAVGCATTSIESTVRFAAWPTASAPVSVSRDTAHAAARV